MTEIITMPKQHLIMGKNFLQKDFFIKIKNMYGFPKPSGGLWCSPYYPEGNFISSWHKWCYYSQPDWLSNEAIIVNFKDEAKVFIINS